MQHLSVLKERQRWMHARIEAKKSIGWETQWDERELAALTWAISELEHPCRLPR
jgi:hypothetical protein